MSYNINGDNMLRVFIDSNREVKNEIYEHVNFQTLSLDKLFNSSSFDNYLKLLKKYQEDKEDVLIITSLENKRIISEKLLDLGLNNIIIFYVGTSPKTIELVRKTILKYQDQSIDIIMKHLDKLLELHETILYMICNLNI